MDMEREFTDLEFAFKLTHDTADTICSSVECSNSITHPAFFSVCEENVCEEHFAKNIYHIKDCKARFPMLGNVIL